MLESEELDPSTGVLSYFENLLEGLDLHSQGAALVNLVFVLRRMGIVASVFWLSNFGLLQILIFVLLSFGSLLFEISTKPHTESSDYRIELINEGAVYLVGTLALVSELAI